LSLLRQMKTLVSVDFIGVLAPRPGLEPGTYGLTGNSFFKLCMFYAIYKP
jgi:hypothetical protein